MGTPLRRPRYEDWTSSPQTRIYTRNSRKARDEKAWFLKTSPGACPRPISIATGEPSPLLESPVSPPRSSEDQTKPPALPQIVDVAGAGSWPRRGLQRQRSTSKHAPSPSRGLKCSTRQSEISSGILDYYMRGPSPKQSPGYPPAPRIETPVLGPAIEKFDFGLGFATPSVHSTNNAAFATLRLDAQQGAKQPSEANPAAPRRPGLAPGSDSKKTYKLFPTTRNTTPTSTTALMEPQTPPTLTQHSRMPIQSSHPQPDPSYRPRKESISSSVRSRKDSLTFFHGTCCIPLRLFSRSSADATQGVSESPSNSPAASRWSDDTMNSPVVGTTSGPRVSSGSLLRGDTARMNPACFFEDDVEDDEQAPLRRNLLWRLRRGGVESEVRWKRPGRFDSREVLGRRALRGVLSALPRFRYRKWACVRRETGVASVANTARFV